MKIAVLVNGVPASGKSTLARRLAAHLHARGVAAVPLGLDTVKEALFTDIGIGDRDHNRMLGRASYRAIFDTIEAFPDDLVPVIDAWHGFQPAGLSREHAARAGLDALVEVWCEVEPAIAAARYQARSEERRPGHPPASYAEELERLARSAKPLARSEGGPDIAALVSVDPVGEGHDTLKRIASAVLRLKVPSWT